MLLLSALTVNYQHNEFPHYILCVSISKGWLYIALFVENIGSLLVKNCVTYSTKLLQYFLNKHMKQDYIYFFLLDSNFILF